MKNEKVGRQYPRAVWVLSPAYVVKQVTVVKRSYAYSSMDYGDETEDRKCYSPEDMHETKSDAIAYGRKQIEARRKFLESQSAKLDAKSAKLDKAEKSKK